MKPAAYTPADLLRSLEALRTTFGRTSASRKRSLVRALARRRFTSAADVTRFHEALCFMRAYPDSRAVLRDAEQILDRFERRSDLKRFREDLEDSGIAGTSIWFQFFNSTARWLADTWPRNLTISWPDVANEDQLETLLPLLAHYAETPALDEIDLGTRGWLDQMKGRKETDASFLVRRMAAVFEDSHLREMLHDALDVPMWLHPGPDTPSRTRAKYDRARVHLQTKPFAIGRPDLTRELRRRPVVRPVSVREGRKLIALVRGAMITRSRDLDAFAWADERDVRMVDFGSGLQFACMGQLPERRLLLESVYGYLTLKNGVPVGYVLTGSLLESSEVAYNVFDTFRGAEAAGIYGHVLAMTRHLFGANTFMVPPYQLGAGNDEALQSGAWWFYQKLGFLPRDRATVRLMNRELARMQKTPGYRSSIRTLDRLSSQSLYWSPQPVRHDVMGEFELANVGMRVTDLLAKRFGSDREGGSDVLASEAMKSLGLASRSGFSRGETLAWDRWAPIVCLIPGIARWSPAEKRAAVKTIRAKGGRRESDFVRLFDRHVKLRRAVTRLAGS